MSIVAISQTLGSWGDRIGRQVAEARASLFADQEIIVRAAERFGEDMSKLQQFTEHKPGLLERFDERRERYRAYVEAATWELAARDDVVLSGRGSAFLMRTVRHALRVRITAPEGLRARRLEQQEGLPGKVALERVRHDARERAARVRSLYQVDWDDPLVYDLVLNTEHLAVADGARIIEQALRADRFQATTEAHREVEDLSVSALARASLLADPRTRQLWVSSLVCRNGELTVGGVIDRRELRQVVEEIVSRVPGVAAVRNELALAADGTRGSGHHHG
jgi:cytidylate kinase